MVFAGKSFPLGISPVGFFLFHLPFTLTPLPYSRPSPWPKGALFENGSVFFPSLQRYPEQAARRVIPPLLFSPLTSRFSARTYQLYSFVGEPREGP